MTRFLRTSFGSALLGGAVVAAFFALAISVGWIDAKSTTTTTIPAPLTAPVSSKESGETNTVNEIYRHDGQGVAFIESTLEAEEASSIVSPLEEPADWAGAGPGGTSVPLDFVSRALAMTEPDGRLCTVCVQAGQAIILQGTCKGARDTQIVFTGCALVR